MRFYKKMESGFRHLDSMTSSSDLAGKEAGFMQAEKLLRQYVDKYSNCLVAARLGTAAQQIAEFADRADDGRDSVRVGQTAGKYFLAAANYYHIAAKGGDPVIAAQAKSDLSLLHEWGVLPEGKNLDEAFKLRKAAADAGHGEAQMNLAVMYFRGEGTVVSYDEARKWLLAAQGDPRWKGTDISEEEYNDMLELSEALQVNPAPERPSSIHFKYRDPFEIQHYD